MTLRSDLGKFVNETTTRLEKQNQRFRNEGAAARARGAPASSCQHFHGSYVSVRWLEGWSNSRAPKREFKAATGWTMTPAEEISAFTDWIMAIGLPADQARQYLELARDSYVAEVLPRSH